MFSRRSLVFGRDNNIVIGCVFITGIIYGFSLNFSIFFGRRYYFFIV